MIKKSILLLFAFILLSTYSKATDEARLLRFPAIGGGKIVFTYAGDLYSVEENGGMARKLTSHEGFEMFARFSPDGNYLAFTGQYDGNTEVYLMPAEGGTPERLTYTATLGRDDISDRMGPNNIVMTWTTDGKEIIYRSRRFSYNDFRGALFSVAKDGGLSKEIPLNNGGFCSYSPDGSKLAFNRVFREFRTWKYYQGGMADDIWIYDTKTENISNITNNVAQDIIPMWYKNEIFFISNRDRVMNLFVYNTETQATEKLTNFTDFDIKFPSLGDGKIVFEKGGFIYIYNIEKKTTEKITIQIADDGLMGRNEIKDASKNLSSFTISPDGQRLGIVARGEIFSVPAESGICRNLTQSSNAHDRNVKWSPDGENIAWISDKSGETEIWIQKQDGSQDAIQLTTNADTYYYGIEWSPDGKKIAWTDKLMRLRYIDIATKTITEVAVSEVDVIYNYSWSPDSKWIAYQMPKDEISTICVYNVETKISTEITDGWYNSSQVNFSRDGKYLLFSSARDFNPIYSDVEWNSAYKNMNKIYLLPLSKETSSPFAPKNNEVGKQENQKQAENKVVVTIDFENIDNRLVALPIAASNYWNIECINNKVYYNEMSHTATGINFKMYDLEKQKETIIGSDYRYGISANGKKMAVSKSEKIAVIDIPVAEINPTQFVDFSELKVEVNRTEEWTQIYFEAWRQMRDFFYVENMHGVDWKAMKEKYAVLLPYVKHKADLNYIIGELIGELNVGHAYINGGDYPIPTKVKTGLLGAKISKDKSGYFKIDEILEGANWSTELRSPLTENNINAKEGDFIIAVNGISTIDMKDIYKALVGKVGKQVELTINTKASETGARKIIAVPIGDEANLYYYKWVQHNIDYVNEKTDGKVGYIHVPDMGPVGLNEFMKHFYPQLNKKALIIDDRGNGGGNVSPMLLERLSRKVYRAKMRRNLTEGKPVPNQALVGPMVMLMDNYSASDGDQFPHGFRALGLGTVIGTRSWGGVVGIWGSLPFVDGTDLRKPESGSYDPFTGEWIIEGVGVIPDIEIDNNPALEYKNIDTQLDKAIEVILKDLENYKIEIAPVPAAPDKSK